MSTCVFMVSLLGSVEAHKRRTSCYAMSHARHSWESDSDVEPSPPDEPIEGAESDAESSAEAELVPSPADEFIALMANLVISREVSAKVF